MALFDFDEREIDYDLLAEHRAERRRAAQRHHWCEVCHGHLGPGSPCAPEEDEQPEEESSDE